MTARSQVLAKVVGLEAVAVPFRIGVEPALAAHLAPVDEHAARAVGADEDVGAHRVGRE